MGFCTPAAGDSPSEAADANITMQDNPSYSAVQGGLVMQMSQPISGNSAMCLTGYIQLQFGYSYIRISTPLHCSGRRSDNGARPMLLSCASKLCL